ncbi:hypothetical protein [Bartonella melophagi]|uniref:DNA-binding protein n=1 Tax=Bartonella melophagi K-2C TaxID=1094557 RepID=J0ZQP6_9HYPH|nr:hypothetical protein [Bartonella melophagi]EJF90968.1 hypothetical protein ME3_00549 [Bartonella melophagi K-2C]
MVNNFSVKNLIEFWGSIRQFAEEVGCSYEAARKMRDRNSISPKYWNIIIQLSQSKGLSWVTINWFLHTYENKSRKIYFPMTKHHKDAVYSERLQNLMQKKETSPSPEFVDGCAASRAGCDQTDSEQSLGG